MLVGTIIRSSLDIREFRQIPILDISEVLAQRSNVLRINARSSADVYRWRRARPSVHIVDRVGEVSEGRRRERIVRIKIAVIDLPRDPRAVELLEDRLPVALPKMV